MRWFLFLTAALVALSVWGWQLYRGPGPKPGGIADRPLPRSLAKAPDSGQGPLRITVFGTSLTQGYDWPETLAATLPLCLDRDVTITRVARGGMTVEWGYGQLDRVLDSRPHVILMEFSANDADFKGGVRIDRSRRLTREIVEAVQAARPETGLVLMSMNPAQQWRGIFRMLLPVYYADYRRFAEDYNLGFLDLEARWRAIPRSDRSMRDGIHPEPEMAESVIVPALLNYLGGEQCGMEPT